MVKNQHTYIWEEFGEIMSDRCCAAPKFLPIYDYFSFTKFICNYCEILIHSGFSLK